MKIEIEFREGCSLEIAHIGTSEQIAMQIALDRAFRSAADVGQQLREAVYRIGEAAAEAGRQFAAFLKTQEGN
ncbi:hypothetical protein M0R72_17940 [Candidatus Pacearchaeota archaeon]|jgi:hypothetical protein|nr:hypothetical protein [Candidatus Pacearchaeota archaeon]